MVTRNVWCCARRAVFAALLVSVWAGGGTEAAVTLGRERHKGASGVVTPHPEAARQYKYIPLGYRDREYSEEQSETPDPEPPRPKLAPSELVLTIMRTALDVVRRVNSNRAAAAASRGKLPPPPPPPAAAPANTTALQETGRGRGDMDDYYDDHHDTTTTAKPAKPRYTDPWAGYYDFIINEGSFKFWSVFQLFTAALLLYACLSAIYYAKFNPIIPDYDREYDDYFLERSAGRSARSLDPSLLPSGLSWMGPSTFQFIMDALDTNYKQ